MQLDPENAPRRDVYKLMVSGIVPRPIAFVSTVDADGRTNVAPFSFFTGITSKPPLLGVSILHREGAPKDTLRNVRETGEFVVNVVPAAIWERMVEASGDWPHETSEFDVAGLTPVPSVRVRAPRVAECPLAFECVVHQEVPLGDASFVVGRIVLVHADDSVIEDGRVLIQALNPVARLGGDEYARLGEILVKPRPIVPRPTGGS